MILTYENLHLASTSYNGCGWTKRQLIIIGVLKEGEKFNQVKKKWLKSLIGTEVPDEVYNAFVFAGRQKMLSKLKNKSAFIEPNKQLNWNDQYLHPNWQKMRTLVLTRDCFKCVRCGDDQTQLHVHHLKYEKGKYIWEVDIKYLVTLCEKCHNQVHYKKKDMNTYLLNVENL